VATTVGPVSSEIRAAFGQRVRGLRLARGLSQEQTALRAGFSARYLSDVERGARNVGLENISLLASALEIRLAELFDDSAIDTSTRRSP